MKEQREKPDHAKPIPTVQEVIDREFMTNGDGFGKIWTREELEEHHRIGDLLDERVAKGYTIEQINADWTGKTSQEILAEAEVTRTTTQV